METKIYVIRFYHNDKILFIGTTTRTLDKAFKEQKYKNSKVYNYIQKYNDLGEFNYETGCYIELLEKYKFSSIDEDNMKRYNYIKEYKKDKNNILINDKNITHAKWSNKEEEEEEYGLFDYEVTGYPCKNLNCLYTIHTDDYVFTNICNECKREKKKLKQIIKNLKKK